MTRQAQTILDGRKRPVFELLRSRKIIATNQQDGNCRQDVEGELVAVCNTAAVPRDENPEGRIDLLPQKQRNIVDCNAPDTAGGCEVRMEADRL